MTILLGKRKRRADLYEDKHTDASYDSAAERYQALLRKHFEANYEPLEVAPIVPTQAQSDSGSQTDDDDDDDWSGISDDDSADVVEVVDSSTISSAEPMSKEERKLFMSAKPPSSSKASKPKKQKPSEDDEDPTTEAALLKNDLELQRLLRESHLLSSSPSDSLNVTGKIRHKAFDLRMLALGAKKSHLAQKSMPMSHRKGIVATKRTKEQFRRREAKENGIILEKEQKSKDKRAERRERGVGSPAVGRFKSGTLQLSKKDIKDIQGPRGSSARGGKGGKGKRR